MALPVLWGSEGLCVLNSKLQGGNKMRIEKHALNDALRVLGKAVYQTSPVELYRSVRFVGDPGDVRAMVTDGVEVVSVKVTYPPADRRQLHGQQS